jgi:hypothetical protein
LTQGFRKSEFGFNQIPESNTFIRKYDVFNILIEEPVKKKQECGETSGEVVKFEEDDTANNFAKFKIKDDKNKEEMPK